VSATLADVVPNAAGWVFSPAFLWQVVDGRHRSLLRALGVSSVLHPKTTVARMYGRIYDEMLRSYRVEYVYKNEIIRRLFEEQHDPDVAAVVLEQQVAGRSTRLDLLVVNDTTTAYEVKTEHDSLVRLERQIGEALRVFDHVVIACADDYVADVRRLVDSRVGIVRLGRDGTLRAVRKSRPNARLVEPAAVFAVLRQREAIAAVEDRFGPVPALLPGERYAWCLDRFSRFAPRDAHAILLTALRQRHIRIGHRRALKGLGHEMAHLYYKLSGVERTKLLTPTILSRPIG
jgi:hypothetical protein